MLQRLPVKPIMTVQRALLLSYLCGLAPVGREFWFYYKHARKDLADLKWISEDQSALRHIMERLVDEDFAVERVAPHVYRVLKRPEEFNVCFYKATNVVKTDPIWREYA